MPEPGFASLNQTLLARKGGAKPAMRPQLGPIADNAIPNLDDLGWNDMGSDHGEMKQSAIVVPLVPHLEVDPSKGHVARRSGKQAARKKTAVAAPGKRAAFTLRLDMQRHLKLRLASTISNRSAQQIVTEALDALLAQFDDLDSLAAQVQRG